MATSSARASRTLAQWYCLLVGAVLLIVGILGFVADSSFDTGADVEGGSFLGFEVNGWHNLVHLASGVVLLAAANLRPTAKTTAIGFGFVYLIVTLWGLIDGDTVLGVIPVNGADNVLHLLIAALGIGLGMTSPTTKRQQIRRDERRPSGPDTTTAEPPVRHDAAAGTSEPGPATGTGTGDDITRTRS